jgi:SAM-dependent methyltransferase
VGSPSVPSRQMWEAQYHNGYWARLKELKEQAHNAVVLSYITHLRPQGSLLEVGCGEGTLLPQLKRLGYRNYTGVDISESAIRHCQQFTDAQTVFVACDAESYMPNAAFDIIILNECIYYFLEPVATLQRYANYLLPGGLIVISVFDSAKSSSIRRSLKRVFVSIDETLVSNASGRWYSLVLSPKRPANEPTPIQQGEGRLE